MAASTISDLEEARRCLTSGRFKQVLALCRPILSGAPHDPDVSALAGAALLGLGRAFQALCVIAPSCEANPERVDLQLLRISCLLNGGKFQLARGSAERALQFDPANADLKAALRQADARIDEFQRMVAAAARPLLTEAQRTALRDDLRTNYRTVPIVINSRDRCSCLRELIAWLRWAGYTNIAILDNDSTYPPLLEYLREVEQTIVVFRSKHNYGPRALWSSGVVNLVSEVAFVYTDPDVVPTEDCPRDAILVLADLLTKHRHAAKAGLGIRIDDIPDTYEHKAAVRSWEAQFWQRPLPGNCYDASVDTTFALYRPGSWHHVRAVRSGPPYLVKHLPWYVDSSKPTAEDQYYAAHAVPHMTSWSGKRSIGDA
jgi:tetratricopeptide (TPR) repeat protein